MHIKHIALATAFGYGLALGMIYGGDIRFYLMRRKFVRQFA